MLWACPVLLVNYFTVACAYREYAGVESKETKASKLRDLAKDLRKQQVSRWPGAQDSTKSDNGVRKLEVFGSAHVRWARNRRLHRAFSRRTSSSQLLELHADLLNQSFGSVFNFSSAASHAHPSSTAAEASNLEPEAPSEVPKAPKPATEIPKAVTYDAPTLETGTPSETPKAPTLETGTPSETPKAPTLETGTPSEATKAPTLETGKLSETPKAPTHETGAPSQTPKVDRQLNNSKDAVNHSTHGLEAFGNVTVHERMLQLQTSILKDLEEQNIDQLNKHLQNLTNILVKSAKMFDVNKAFLPFQNEAATFRQSSQTNSTSMNLLSKGIYSNWTLLAYAAQAGWPAGLSAVVEWGRGHDELGLNLDLDCSGQQGTTPLLLAMQAQAPQAVQYLIEHGASLFSRDVAGLTPLEAAVKSGSVNMVSAILLANHSALSFSLLKLRTQIAQESNSLPTLRDWWSVASSEKLDGMMHIRQLVPQSLQPAADVRNIVGELPADWVLLYRNRIMNILFSVTAQTLTPDPLQALLSEHGFDDFAVGYTMNTVLLCFVLSLFFVFVYLSFRIRIYGQSEVPISLAELLPGAFDTSRLTHPDFDPSRQKSKLPYRSVMAFVATRTICGWNRFVALAKAWLGVYSSWLLLSVRIPPEKDTFDEDYLSDDDEESRQQVREACAEKAKHVKLCEVVLRLCAFFLVLWWLIRGTGRWCDAFFLLGLYFYHAWIISAVACSSEPTASKESDTGDTAPRDLDAASLVVGLFGVQHGPRWTRACGTTRSTAAPTKSRLARRGRLRRSNRQAGTDSSGETETAETKPSTELDDPTPEADTGATTESPEPLIEESTSLETMYSDRFQRSLLNSGILHVNHSAYLELSLTSMVSAFVTAMWLLHLQQLCSGNFRSFYERLTPVDLFYVYGSPGTSDRWLALSFEVLLLWLCTERLQEICNVLNVATLSLQQRSTALTFLSRHPPPPVKRQPDEVKNAKETMKRIDELVRCNEFAIELSDARWLILRRPVMAIGLWTVFLFAVAIVLMLLPLLQAPLLTPLIDLSLGVLDPLVPLTIALCMICPLLTLLFAANSCNIEVRRQQSHIRSEAERALSRSPAGREDYDVQYVQLRGKAYEALEGKTLRWPAGAFAAELGLTEPLLIVIIAFLAVGLALVRGFNVTLP
jgi:hypothetical protein